ncbi:MAG TPA: hypothetical protein VF970_12010 [Gemmatimonadales bacterium]
MQRLATMVLALGLMGSSGCYRFEPVTLDAVPQGSTIRAVLSPAASERLRERHRVQNGGALSGTLLAANAQDLSLWVASVPLSPEFGAKTLYQQVDIAKADVWRVDLRRLDAGKTGFALVGGAAALVIVGRSTLLGGTRGAQDPGGGLNESRRRWLLPLVLGWF